MNLVKKQNVIISGLVFIGIFLFFFCASFDQRHKYERLGHEGIHTFGTVTAKEPAIHNSIRYEYSVSTNRYSGMSSAGYGGLPQLEQISIGEQIPVTYLSDNPEISVPGDPQEIYQSQLMLIFLGAPFLALFGATVTYFRLHKKPFFK